MRGWARRRFAAAAEAEDVEDKRGKPWCERCSGGLAERPTVTALGRRQHRLGWRSRFSANKCDSAGGALEQRARAVVHHVLKP